MFKPPSASRDEGQTCALNDVGLGLPSSFARSFSLHALLERELGDGVGEGDGEGEGEGEGGGGGGAGHALVSSAQGCPSLGKEWKKQDDVMSLATLFNSSSSFGQQPRSLAVVAE